MRFGLTLLVRPSIGETLADDALRGHFGAHIVIVTERCARPCQRAKADVLAVSRALELARPRH
jgi:hypothetical protein